MAFEDQQLARRYQDICENIIKLSTAYHRKSQEIKLVAVSKRHSPDKVIDLIKIGHREFAENYLQEGLDKIQHVGEYCQDNAITDPIYWHFIGHIQSKKCKNIAQNFHWVHTVDSLKVAEKLNQHRPPLAPLNVLIQLNLQKEESKSGIGPDQLAELANAIKALPNLVLRGLMIIPMLETDLDHQRSVFKQCKLALEGLNHQGHNLDQLSMGMTGDMEAAIAEGSTQIRIGTAIFGARPQ